MIWNNIKYTWVMLCRLPIPQFSGSHCIITNWNSMPNLNFYIKINLYVLLPPPLPTLLTPPPYSPPHYFSLPTSLLLPPYLLTPPPTSLLLLSWIIHVLCLFCKRLQEQTVSGFRTWEIFKKLFHFWTWPRGGIQDKWEVNNWLKIDEF